MKKSTAITGFLAITLVALSVATVSALELGATTETDVRSGGLGTGLNSMVRSILNESSETLPPQAPQPAAQTMMMSAEATADTSFVPNVQTMKASPMNAAFSMETAAQTDDDVRELIRSLLKNNSNVQSIDASDSHVRLTFRTKASKLRFLKVTMSITGEAYASGGTTVTYPWYATRAGVKSDIRIRFDEQIAPLIAGESLTPENRIALISTMHAFFTEEFASK